jgi:hypothetical protein
MAKYTLTECGYFEFNMFVYCSVTKASIGRSQLVVADRNAIISRALV